jgi:DNA-directed RNA polymerase subunit N (RpoN/RPB10)
MASLCAVRCFCGREIQRAYTRFRELQESGKTIKEALDECGLPTSSPFVGPDEKDPTPPPVCCRAWLMSNVDLTGRHNVLQRIVRWADGSVSATHRQVALQQLGGRASIAASAAPASHTTTPTKS